MKKYTKPSIEVMTIGVMSQVLQSSIEIHDGVGDPDRQTAPSRKNNIVDDYGDDEGNDGW